jgi:carbamoyltransferase
VDREYPRPYFGSASFSDTQIVAALTGAGVSGRRVESPARTCADLVAHGNIVGWFQGGAEVGPRALGNRSIVADPRNSSTKDLINIKVKHREYFRPFAPAVLAEEAAEWFEFRRPSLSTGFMSFAVPVRPGKRALVPAVVHVDGSARMRTVHGDVNPLFHGLISEFRALTGVPLVVNTSFNTFDGPIVHCPEDAIRTFLRTGMDAMIIGDHLVLRSSL